MFLFDFYGCNLFNSDVISGKIYLGRSAIRDVAEKRLPELNNYLKVFCVCLCLYAVEPVYTGRLQATSISWP